VETQPSFEMDSDVAIVGVSGRFPGAENIDEFWRNLRDGMESIRTLSVEELAAAGVERSMLGDPHYVRAHAPLAGVEFFDAGFFGMTPREAAMIDPQQRLFLECAWETLEGAGYDPERFAGRIGVYAGAGMNT
jgi:acyl transferase domain-containing protein